VVGEANVGSSSRGVSGLSTAGTGVYGSTNNVSNAGVFGMNASGIGVRGETSSATLAAVYGINNSSGYYAIGVQGTSSNGDGVHGVSTGGNGVYGQSDTAPAIWGKSNSNAGAYGLSETDDGVYGVSSSGNGLVAGVYGKAFGTNSNGVIGEANFGSSAYGVWGKSTSGFAGYFTGNVHVTGGCCMAAEGSFQIDHPQDPANKYLNMAAVASPDMKDIYDGVVTTDAKGEATVTLPSYFETLNRDFRYQLTIMGDQFAQARVSSKIKDNRFSIKTDKPNVEISWQVTGIRHDPYAEQHPITSEQAKPANERGFYLHPELYNQPDSKQMDNARPGMNTRDQHQGK
jgi:hypothetical protein